jgi:hypothetical protein
MPGGFGQAPPQQQQFQQQPQQQLPQQGQPGQPGQPQQQFRPPQEQTLQAGVKVGGPQQGARQPYYSPAPPQPQGAQGGQPGYQQGGYQPPHVPEFKVAGVGGGPWDPTDHSQHRSRFSIGQLRQSDGIIPLQYGTNRFASQKKMTGFGTPRDVNGKHLHRIWDDFYTDESEPFEGQQQQGEYYAQQ